MHECKLSLVSVSAATFGITNVRNIRCHCTVPASANGPRPRSLLVHSGQYQGHAGRHLLTRSADPRSALERQRLHDSCCLLQVSRVRALLLVIVVARRAPTAGACVAESGVGPAAPATQPVTAPPGPVRVLPLSVVIHAGAPSRRQSGRAPLRLRSSPRQGPQPPAPAAAAEAAVP